MTLIRREELIEFTTSTPSRVALVAHVTWWVVALGSFTIHILLFWVNWTRWLEPIVSSAFTGAVAATTVWYMLAAVAARRKLLNENVRRVAELNHQIRNSLQTILYATQLSNPEKGTLELVMDAVGRIDRSLQEIFPSEFRRFRRQAQSEPT
jgi:hypothetical protein